MSDPSSRSSVALAGGLVAFLTGFSALVAAAVLPNPQSHPGAVLAAAANRVGPAPAATRQGLAWVTGNQLCAAPPVIQVSAHRRSEPITMDDYAARYRTHPPRFFAW